MTPDLIGFLAFLSTVLLLNQAHECHYEIETAWLADTGSSPIVSSPLIADVNGDNVMDVAVTTFDGLVTVVDGRTGHQLPGWPLVSVGDNFHAAPLLYDIDKDGMMEVVLATSDGQVKFVQLDATIMPGQILQIPPLKLKKNWFTVSLDQIKQDQTKMLSPFSPKDAAKIADVSEFINQGNPGLEPSDHIWSKYQPGKPPTGLSPDGTWVYVDPHILSTPVITDFNGDGLENELVIPVNFYFDHERMSSNLPPTPGLSSAELENYLGSGVVVFNLDDGSIIYNTVMEVTKRSDLFPGYTLSSPTIVDNTSVVIGTSAGSVYLVNRTKLQPITLASVDSVLGQVSVTDVNDDGTLEVLVVDDSGNVACIDLLGKMVWESRVSGSSSAGIRSADINSDGTLEVIFATYDGYVWALSGETGKVLQGWPVKLPGQLRAAVLVTKLQPGHGVGLDVIVPLLDGNLAIIRGSDHCTEFINIGMTSLTSAVTADLLPWKQGMELVLGGTDGTVMCLGQISNDTTDSTSDFSERTNRLFSWTAETAPCTGTTFYSGKVGVSFTKSTHQNTQFSGSVYPVEFEITDLQPGDLRWNNYRTKVFIGNRQLAVNKTFTSPGVYTEHIATPPEPMRAVLVIKVMIPNNQCFQDSIHISFNMHYLEDFHWYLLAPFLTMSCLLLVLHGNAPPPDILPTIIKNMRR